MQDPTGNEDTKPSDHNCDMLGSNFKSIVREWSLEGAEERTQCFQLIINSVLEHCNSCSIQESQR